jgi:hypothetical protein
MGLTVVLPGFQCNLKIIVKSALNHNFVLHTSLLDINVGVVSFEGDLNLQEVPYGEEKKH